MYDHFNVTVPVNNAAASPLAAHVSATLAYTVRGEAPVSITTASVYGTILAYRIKRMSFKEISKLIGVSAVATSKRLDKLIEYYRSRKPKMIFHQLEGETWVASNARKKEFEWNALMDSWAERHQDPFTLQSRIPFVISKTWR